MIQILCYYSAIFSCFDFSESLYSSLLNEPAKGSEKNNNNNRSAKCILFSFMWDAKYKQKDVQNRLNWGFACSHVYPSASVWYQRVCVRYTLRTHILWPIRWDIHFRLYGIWFVVVVVACVFIIGFPKKSRKTMLLFIKPQNRIKCKTNIFWHLTKQSGFISNPTSS